MDFIEEFVHATRNLASPVAFRRWAAVAMVSAAMSVKIWTRIEDDKKLYGNMYIWLVAPPGIGKGRAMSLANELLSSLFHIEFSPDEVTRQRVIERLGELFEKEAEDKGHCYMCFTEEVATFLPELDIAWMQGLAKIWDVPPVYRKEIKTGDKTMDWAWKPYLVWLAGAQPAWFSHGFPPDAEEMGLPARTMYIYADEKPARTLFRDRKSLEGTEHFTKHLRAIAQRRGDIPWSGEAQATFVKWMDGGQKPVVNDPMMKSYNTRRDMHAAKLALVVAVGRGHAQIEKEDVETSLRYLFEAEKEMPKALRNAGGNTLLGKSEMIVTFIREEYKRTGKPVGEALVRRRMDRHVNSLQIHALLNELIAQKRVKALFEKENRAPYRLLTPAKEKKEAVDVTD